MLSAALETAPAPGMGRASGSYSRPHLGPRLGPRFGPRLVSVPVRLRLFSARPAFVQAVSP